MSEPTKPVCVGCRYYKSTNPEYDLEHGECHRFPPVLNLVLVQVDVKRDVKHDKLNGRICDRGEAAMRAAEGPWAWVFPMVDGDQWCGEFQEGDADTGGE